jgi:hypothetical protein
MQGVLPIKAVTYWACLSHKNEMSDKYQVDLCLLSDAAVAKLSESGIPVKNKDDDRGNFITCKSANPIRSYFEDGSQIVEGTLIGNGSRVVASVGSYDWEFKGKKGTSPSLKRLVVTDLVEFGDGVEDEPIDLEAAL